MTSGTDPRLAAELCTRCRSAVPTGANACPACGLGTELESEVARLEPEVEPLDGLAAMQEVRGALAGEYEIVEELGRGGMAIVYRARERELDRDVALKVLPFHFTFDGDFVERFLREARTAAQLEHPNIVPIYRVGRAGHVTYFVMKYLRGEGLATLLARRGTLSPPEIRRMLVEVGSALAYAARRGVVHRDIKTDNILVDEEGRCVVTDFGIAKSGAGGRLTASGMSLGTPRYMSPEQARARPLDGRSDIYSLGIVAYECLVGQVPFDAEDNVAVLMAQVHEPLPRPSLETEEARALYALIARMLHKDPAKRIQTGDELVRLVSMLAMGAKLPPARARGVGAPDRITLTLPVTREQAQRAAAAARTAGVELAALARGAGRHTGIAATRAARWAHPRLRLARSRSRLWLRDWAVPHLGRAAAWAEPRLLGAVARVRAHPWYRWMTASRRRAAAVLVALVALLLIGRTALHFALHHRSRCPEPGAPGAPGREGWAVLLDPIGTHRAGDELDVYYDVCGMGSGAVYHTRLLVERNESALRRIFEGAEPMAVSYDERATGAATRRHRTLDLGRLSAGAYTLDVEITDAGGRSYGRSHDFQVVE